MMKPPRDADTGNKYLKIKPPGDAAVPLNLLLLDKFRRSLSRTNIRSC